MTYTCAHCGNRSVTRICAACQHHVEPEKGPYARDWQHDPIEDDYSDESDADSVASDAREDAPNQRTTK